MTLNPKEILSQTSAQVRETVTEILEIEREYQHFQDLKSAKKLDEVKSRIIKLVKQEIKE
jgi:hypothetical protein